MAYYSMCAMCSRLSFHSYEAIHMLVIKASFNSLPAAIWSPFLQSQVAHDPGTFQRALKMHTCEMKCVHVHSFMQSCDISECNMCINFISTWSSPFKLNLVV